MFILQIIVALISLGFGVYHLINEPGSPLAVYHLALALYFYAMIHELRGEPLSRWVYILNIVLLLGIGLYFFFFQTQANPFVSIISFLFAFASWGSLQRLPR